MYGLPQSGLLAQQLMERRLNAEGYNQDTTLSTLPMSSQCLTNTPSVVPISIHVHKLIVLQELVGIELCHSPPLLAASFLVYYGTALPIADQVIPFSV